MIKNFGTFYWAKSRYVGVEINLWKEVSGWVKIFWSPEDGVWEEKNSLQRFYPEGDIKAQFAFENNINNPLFFRVDTIQDSKARIGDIQLYCLHEK